ncbi:hypothetical protein D3C80_1812360 [compost metagenome]
MVFISIWPSPPRPERKNNSETIAAMTARLPDMRKPAKRAGAADGRPAFRNMMNQLAPCRRNKSIIPRSTLFSPNRSVVGMAKKVNSATINTFGKNPNPIALWISGIIAMIGMDCRATR